MLRVGLELWNTPTLGTAEERDRLWALNGSCVKVRCYPESGDWQAWSVVDYLLSVMPDCLFLLRRSADGLLDPAGQVAEARPFVQAIKARGKRAIYILSNEDNQQDSPYHQLGLQRYKSDLRRLILEADSLGVDLCSPPLAVQQDDLFWLGALEPTCRAYNVEYRAAHLYWQGDNHQSPDWGRRLQQYSAIVPGARWIVDEVGDSSDDAQPAERAARILDVLHWLRGRGDVSAACIFLAGSSDPQWSRFILPAADLATIAAGLVEETIPEVPTVQYTTIGQGYRVIDRRGDLPSNGEYPLRDLAGIEFLVAHHSGVAVDSTAESINDYHQSLGWPGLSYAFLIHQDGRTEYTLDISRAGYTVAGRNPACLSVCFVGDWSKQAPPAVMLDAGRRLFAELQYTLGKALPVMGHGEVALPGYASACPGATWPQWKAAVTPAGGDDVPEIDKAAILASIDTLWGIANGLDTQAQKLKAEAARIRDYVVAIKTAAGIE